VQTGTTTAVVLDPVGPVARPKQAVSVYLSANGQAVINPSLMDSASTDNCSITARLLSQSVFNCSNIGSNNVLFTVQDQSGNANSANIIVTVFDTVRPIATISNQNIYLNSTGTASITAAQVNNNSTDNCGVATVAINKSTFSCADLGSSNIIFTATDINGNSKAANVNVNVFDSIRPIVRPRTNVLVYLNSTGTGSITLSNVDSASSDNCSIASRILSQTNFTCANIGSNIVTLTAIDVTGNEGSRNFVVTVLDTVKPLVTAQTATIYLNSSGGASLSSSQVVNSSSDNCSSTTIALSQTNFTCTNLGSNTVNITSTDASGNFRTIPTTVTVIDSIKPILNVQNRTIYLNVSGTVSLTATQVNNGSTDNCGIQTTTISKTNFVASDLGLNTITFTATDASGNSQTINVVITVLDTVRPIALTQNRTIYLNATGNATVTANQVNNGSSDNSGNSTLLLSKTAFNCSDLGANQVFLTVTDGSNNSTSASATITVLDTIKPIVVGQNVTTYLNGLGQATVAATQVNNGSTDNCSISSFSLSKTNFTCNDKGANTVTLTAIDASGNTSNTNVTITVLDTIKPNVIVNNNLNIYLNNAGNASVNTNQINNGTNDNCGISSLAISKSTFNASNLGLNVITFTATDPSGNTQTGNINITVLDTIRPVVITQNRTLYLNTSGNASVTASQINNGSSDNAGSTSTTLLLSKTTFTCSDLGANVVSLTVTDGSNNSTSATAIVTVLDTIKPTVVAQNLNVYLNGLGSATITPQQVNNGSTDNCSISSLSLSKTNFGCSDRGINNITFTATDASGNFTTTNVTITIIDTIKPNIVVNNNLNLYLNASGTVSLNTAQVNNGSTDNCGITSLSLSKTSFNGTNLGLNIVTFTATDASSNSQSVTLNIIVIDTVKPIVNAQGKTIYLNTTGSASLTASEVNNGSTDNVAIGNISINKTLFNCNDVGDNSVQFTATDLSGNSSSTLVNISVVDTILPIVTFMPTNVRFGHCGAGYRYTMPTATDNCGDVKIVQTDGVALGNTYPVGTTTNIFTFTDKSGNKVTRSFTVTILPSYLPETYSNIVVCSDVKPFDLTKGKSNIVFTGSGVTLDGKSFDPALSGSGNYNVTFIFTDSMNCETKGNFFVTVNRSPEKPIISRQNANVLEVFQQFNSYQWLSYGQPLANGNQKSYTMVKAGSYSVRVGTAQGCFTESDAVPVGVNVGVNEGKNQVAFKMYPNPSLGTLYFEIENASEKTTAILIYDALGKLVYESSTNSFVTQVDLSNLADGNYFVRLNQGDKTTIKPMVLTK